MKLEFTIVSITKKEWCGKVEAHVVVEMPAKDWLKTKSKCWLGQLYGVDISNQIHRIDPTINAWCPTVEDRTRSKNGIKTIRLTYRERE